MASSGLHQPADNKDSPYAVYKANVAKMAARAHRDGAPGVLEADDVAAVILKAVTASRPRARYKAGSQARLAPAARRLPGDRGWDAFMRRMVPFPSRNDPCDPPRVRCRDRQPDPPRADPVAPDGGQGPSACPVPAPLLRYRA
jgi:hypothetical protein